MVTAAAPPAISTTMITAALSPLQHYYCRTLSPSITTNTGDPYESQIRSNFQTIRDHFTALGYANVTIAFQNHGGKGTKFPQSLFEWSAPPDTDVVPELAQQICSECQWQRACFADRVQATSSFLASSRSLWTTARRSLTRGLTTFDRLASGSDIAAMHI